MLTCLEHPAIGYHPWYSHTISLEESAPTKEHHYRSVFAPLTKQESVRLELEAILPHLPEPRCLKDIVAELRDRFTRFPSALLGEVGLDRAFRIPTSRDSIKDQISEQGILASDPAAESKPNEHTLALRGKRLTSLGVPIQHQTRVLLAQVGVAVDFGRSISMHSVRAGEATADFLKECCRVYNGTDPSRGAFRDVNLDLHSCTLSAEMLASILRTHSNVFASFSVTINLRQKNLLAQMAVVPPSRMLIESDWHSAEELGERNLDMLRVAQPFLARPSSSAPYPEELFGDEERRKISRNDLMAAAHKVAGNWQRFDHCRRQLTEGDISSEDDSETPALEDFEQRWWKDMKSHSNSNST